jgi:hypothetical protein
MQAMRFRRIGADTRAVFILPLRQRLSRLARHGDSVAQADAAGTDVSAMRRCRRRRISGKAHVPTKLGFKNPTHIVAIEVTNVYPGGFWEDYGYNWFSGS